MKTDFVPELKMKRVAIYLRVSTEEQAKEDKNSLKLQEEKLRQFCSSQDYELKDEHVYCDKGFSGSLKENDRPAMSEMFSAAANKEFDLVIVYRLDRLFRNQCKLLNALQKLVDCGVAFQSATESFDTETPSGRLMLQILGSFAEHERETIRQRMLDGKKKAASLGRWVTGVPPYGYRITKDKRLEIHNEESEVVQKFFEWLVYEKCSLREITRRAIEQDLPTPTHKTIRGQQSKKKDIRIKGNWHKRTINRILVNEVYTGKFYYNKYKRPFKYLSAVTEEEHQRPKEDHIELDVPAIISREMFEKAVEQLQLNRKLQKRNEKRTYLFSGLLYSGYSGRKLQSGYQKPKKNLKNPTLGKYYHVYIPALERSMSQSDQIDTHGQCAESRLIPIWNTLVDILSDPKNTIPKLEEYTFKNSNEAKTRKQIVDVEKQLETIHEEQVRIVEVYTGMQMSKEMYESKMKASRSRQKELEIQKQKLSQSLLKNKERLDRDKIIKNQFRELKEKLKHMSYEDQQYILRLFVERITLHHKSNYAEVVFKFPIKTSIPFDVPTPVSFGNQMRLVLHVKIKSERDRRKEIISTNPAMTPTDNKRVPSTDG